MAKQTRGVNKALGVGLYFERSCPVPPNAEDWIVVELERPLIINQKQARKMEQKYGTTSDDPDVAMSSAWTLRRELIGRGYDSVIAVEDSVRLKIVQLYPSHAFARQLSLDDADGAVIAIFEEKDSKCGLSSE